MKGLRRFASQIRRDHGLEPQQVLPPLKAVESSQQSSVPTPDGRRKKQKGDDQLPADAPDVDAGSCSDGGDSVGTDEEDLLEEDATSRGAGAMEEKSEEEEEGGLAIERPFKEGQDEGNDIPRGAGGAALREDGERERKRKAAFLRAVEAGKAAGLLGEYLRGSPQLHDLLSLWDLDVRKVCYHPPFCGTVLHHFFFCFSRTAVIISFSWLLFVFPLGRMGGWLDSSGLFSTPP